MNNEFKVRQLIELVILKKRKVMSYEDPVKARAKRAEKEAAKEAKGKRNDRKRKSASPEADVPESKAKVARMIEPPEPWKAPVAQMIELPEPAKAPEARM